MEANNQIPQPQTHPLTFDQAVTAELKTACQDIMLRHPEVGDLAVAINWKGNLNDAAIHHGLWIGRNGQVADLAGIFGSSGQAIKLLQTMLERAFNSYQSLRATSLKLGEIIHEQQKEVEARRTADAERSHHETQTQT